MENKMDRWISVGISSDAVALLLWLGSGKLLIYLLIHSYPHLRSLAVGLDQSSRSQLRRLRDLLQMFWAC